MLLISSLELYKCEHKIQKNNRTTEVRNAWGVRRCLTVKGEGEWLQPEKQSLVEAIISCIEKSSFNFCLCLLTPNPTFALGQDGKLLSFHQIQPATCFLSCFIGTLPYFLTTKAELNSCDRSYSPKKLKIFTV